MSDREPLSNRATGQENGSRNRSYCLSYTATLVTFLPAASVVSLVSVRVVLPVENSTVPVTIVLPAFAFVSA